MARVHDELTGMVGWLWMMVLNVSGRKWSYFLGTVSALA